MLMFMIVFPLEFYASMTCYIILRYTKSNILLKFINLKNLRMEFDLILNSYHIILGFGRSFIFHLIFKIEYNFPSKASFEWRRLIFGCKINEAFDQCLISMGVRNSTGKVKQRI